MARPRKSLDLPFYDNMGQCAAQTGIPLDTIKQARRMGCPAFRSGGKVYLAELLPWMFTNLFQEQNTDWANAKKEVDTKLKQIELDEAQGRVVDRNEVTEGCARAVAHLFAELDRILINEIPARGNNRDSLYLRKLGEEECERLKAKLRKDFEKMGGANHPPPRKVKQ